MDDRRDDPSRREEPALARVIDRNIQTLTALRQKVSDERGPQERLADAITEFSGRTSFIYFHAAWFAAWILLNTGRLGFAAFDPFPYGLLTMIVSLEAIFLSAFVLISQKRIAAESERRADLDLHIGLLAEHELTRALTMLDAIHRKLGIDADQNHELAELEQETRPEDVLAEIERIQRRAREAAVSQQPSAVSETST
jgi:uncharacterized membrane protein